MKPPETDIHRRMMRGESIPAWRPGDAAAPRRAARPEPVRRDWSQPITQAEARAAAQQVNEWCKGEGEIDNDLIRLVCQWVLRTTR